jgi:predicted nucleic acid-binding protein
VVVSVVLDTNVVLYHLGNRLAEDLPDGPLCISVISEIELLSYPGLSPDEEQNLRSFLEKINIIELNDAVKSGAIALRRKGKLKLPDAIVLATAKALGATLLTNDLTLAKAEGASVVVPELST